MKPLYVKFELELVGEFEKGQCNGEVWTKKDGTLFK